MTRCRYGNNAKKIGFSYGSIDDWNELDEWQVQANWIIFMWRRDNMRLTQINTKIIR